MTIGEANKILGTELGKNYTAEDIQMVSINIISVSSKSFYGHISVEIWSQNSSYL